MRSDHPDSGDCALRASADVRVSGPPMVASELRAHGRTGTALALLYVFLWASAFVPSRVLSRLGQPLWVLTVRFAIASVLMAGVVKVLRRPWPKRAAAFVQIAW